MLPAFGELQGARGVRRQSAPASEPRRGQATIRNLLTHTAGHGYAFSNRDLLRYHEVTGAPDPFRGLREGLSAPLIADPGSEWNYGINTDWLGQVIEAVSGQDLSRLPRRARLRTAGHVRHDVRPHGRAAPALDGDSQSHRRRWNSRSPICEVPIADPKFWPAGHGFVRHGQRLRALHGGASRRRRARREPHPAGRDRRTRLQRPPGRDRAARRVRVGDAGAVPRHSVTAVLAGLGTRVFICSPKTFPGCDELVAGDWAGLCNTYFWLDRTSGIAVVFLTQVLPFFDPGDHRHHAGDRAGYLRGNHRSGLAKPASPASGETRLAYRREG